MEVIIIARMASTVSMASKYCDTANGDTADTMASKIDSSDSNDARAVRHEDTTVMERALVLTHVRQM